MPPLAVSGAQLMCSFGAAPSALVVAAPHGVTVQKIPAATIMDFAPTTNVPPFGMCTTQSNPAVAAATTAALGVPTPAPCVPVVTGPWSPGAARVTLQKVKALHQACTAQCSYGGAITISNAGQTRVQVK